MLNARDEACKRRVDLVRLLKHRVVADPSQDLVLESREGLLEDIDVAFGIPERAEDCEGGNVKDVVLEETGISKAFQAACKHVLGSREDGSRDLAADGRGRLRDVELVNKLSNLLLIIRRTVLLSAPAETGDLLLDLNGNAECAINSDQGDGPLRPTAGELVRHHPAHTVTHNRGLLRARMFDHGINRAHEQVGCVRDVRLVAAAVAWEVDEQHTTIKK